jgi:hypothetical protein
MSRGAKAGICRGFGFNFHNFGRVRLRGKLFFEIFRLRPVDTSASPAYLPVVSTRMD